MIGEEVNITYRIFNNTNYTVFLGIGSDVAGPEVEKGKRISQTVSCNEKLFIWAAKDGTAPPQDCHIYFPMKVDKCEAGNYEVKVAQRAKKFILSGEPDQLTDVEILVSVRD